MKYGKMENTVLWTWDSRMLWTGQGLQSVILDENAYLANYMKLVDYMADTGIKAVIVWGFLRSSHGGIRSASKLASYASKKGVRIIPGVGVKSYGGFSYETARYRVDDEVGKWSLDQYLLDNPGLIARDENGNIEYWSHKTADLYPKSHIDACPSKTDQLLEWYIKGVEWMSDTFDIGGMWFETGDSLKICQCEACVKRRGKDYDINAQFWSFEDEALWLPVLAGKAKELKPESWVMYIQNNLYNERMCKNPPKMLLEKMPKDIITVWGAQDLEDRAFDAGKVLDDCEKLEAYRKKLPPPEPSSDFNISYWSYGGNWMLWGLDGYPQYRQIAGAIKAGREMGHSGICYYGEIGPDVSMSGRYNHNEINYTAMVEFCNDPGLTVEEFKEKHAKKINPMYGWMME